MIIGIVPALIVTLFLGIFALYTSKLLIDFKLRHPQVHSMGALRALHTAIVASELTCPIRRRRIYPLRTYRQGSVVCRNGHLCHIRCGELSAIPNRPSLIGFKGSELLSGQQALSVLSDNGLCAVYFLLIFACATLLVAMPRTLSQLGWLGIFSVFLIIVCGVLAMIGAGLNPVPGRTIRAVVPNSFLQAFLAVTNPVRLI